MKCIAHFYKLNYDFSPEYAEAHHDGKASPNNRRFDWEDELAVKTNILSYNVNENGTYIIQGERAGESFSEELTNMIVFEFTDDQEQKTFMACSRSIVNKYEIKEEGDQLLLDVYFEEREPLTNPIPGIYVAVQEFPKSLI
tara:strand:- start:4276 stop:4698 length:423 start_codon:yes stop_codon:yes gene_type:complete